MEAKKVQFLDGLEVRRELDDLYKKKQDQIADQQREVIARLIVDAVALAKKEVLADFTVHVDRVANLDSEPLLPDVLEDLRLANWDVSSNSERYFLTPSKSPYAN